jgi:hypothetical protein
LVSAILGWARIDYVDGRSMCVMEEGMAKLGSVQEDVCRIVDFSSFGIRYNILLLVFWGGCSKFNSPPSHSASPLSAFAGSSCQGGQVCLADQPPHGIAPWHSRTPHTEVRTEA